MRVGADGGQAEGVEIDLEGVPTVAALRGGDRDDPREEEDRVNSCGEVVLVIHDAGVWLFCGCDWMADFGGPRSCHLNHTLKHGGFSRVKLKI